MTLTMDHPIWGVKQVAQFLGVGPGNAYAILELKGVKPILDQSTEKRKSYRWAASDVKAAFAPTNGNDSTMPVTVAKVVPPKPKPVERISYHGIYVTRAELEMIRSSAKAQNLSICGFLTSAAVKAANEFYEKVTAPNQ